MFIKDYVLDLITMPKLVQSCWGTTKRLGFEAVFKARPQIDVPSACDAGKSALFIISAHNARKSYSKAIKEKIRDAGLRGDLKYRRNTNTA
ncbi:hypothetical protein EVAR_92273_1 [Eumeta japonica]|uniref:Uncharacterized protein n=1 Tax=Eumeta variegata TaxID=151549 RepID=A0A4C1TNJ9_EUMVA|nr:hypothetical protein EVAR_92273_1 [Eumeta japonica]